MLFKKIKENTYFKHLLNPYIATTVVFVIWMSFFDDNSLLYHNELNQTLDENQNEINRYQIEIEKDKKDLKRLSNPQNLENFARETYYMKKENEDVFLIERPSDQKQANNE